MSRLRLYPKAAEAALARIGELDRHGHVTRRLEAERERAQQLAEADPTEQNRQNAEAARADVEHTEHALKIDRRNRPKG